MTEVERLLGPKRAYVVTHDDATDARPSRRLAVITCMDARIDVFHALGLQLGEAHVLRNAGGRVTDDVLRSLALSTHVLGSDTVIVMQHTKCGLAGVTDEELQKTTGADLGFFPIDDHAVALTDDIAVIEQTPYLGIIQLIIGIIYDVETGKVTEVARSERASAE